MIGIYSFTSLKIEQATEKAGGVPIAGHHP